MSKRTKPNLVLLVGPAGSGKTHSLTQAFEESLRKSENPLADDFLFILPTAEHRSRTIDLVLRSGLGGFFQRRITTFDRALRELLRLGGLDFASDVTRRMILSEILEKNTFRYFSTKAGSASGGQNTAHMRGFLELASRMVIEFKEQLILPLELKKRLNEIKTKFPEFELKYDDLGKIYGDYEEELKKRNLIDQRDSLKLLEEGLNRGELKDPELKRVWIDGFSDFSKLQLAFIEFLTRHADEVTVTLTLDQNPYRKTLFETVLRTQNALLDLGFQIKTVEEKNYRALNPEMAHLERNLFSQEKIKKMNSNSSVQIFEATGLEGEIELIAREIKQLLKAERCHFSDIAVLFRMTDPYIPVIRSVFNQFEIPYELHERFRLRLSPIARIVASFFEIFLNEWQRKDVFNFLKSTHKNNEEISLLELEALKRGLYKGRAYWLEHFPGSESVKGLAKCEDQFLKLKNIDEFNAWLKSVLARFGLFQFPDHSDFKTRFDREAGRRIVLLLEELKIKIGNQSMDPKVMAREFLTLVDVDLFSAHSRDINKVQIYNVSVARQKEYKAVFLAGLLEKQFPIQIKEDPIFSDLERRALNQKGEVLKEKLPRQAFERYLFYMAATRARERLFLTYPHFDLEGKESLPSFYVEEVRNLFGNELTSKKQPITEVLPNLSEMANARDAERLVVSELWNDSKNKKNEDLVFSIYDSLIENPEFQSFAKKLLEPIEGVLNDKTIAKFLVHDIWSPTYLEEYGQCAYRFFADRGLCFQEQEEGIDIKQKGNILHDVLEHFFTWLRDQKKIGKEINFEKAEAYCLARFEEMWNKSPLAGDRFYRIELERKKMREMLSQIFRLELIEEKPPIPGLIPSHFEYVFKDMVLKGKNRKIPLRGKIDRIDIDPSGKYALVIDYKTSKEFKARSLENADFIQLPFYLIAVREKLGLEPLGAHFYALDKAHSTGFHHQANLNEAGIKTRKGKSFSGEEFQKFLDQSVLFAERFVGEIEEGKISIRPRNCVPYCPYSSVCRIEKWRLDHIYQEISEEDEKWLAKSR